LIFFKGFELSETVERLERLERAAVLSERSGFERVDRFELNR
jgi:hypothetical protein